MKLILFGLLRKLFGAFVTKDRMRHVIDLVFVELHNVVNSTATGVDNAALDKLESVTDKDKLAEKLANFLDQII